MQKSKEAAQKEMEAEEGRAACGNEITEALRRVGSRTVFEHSFVPCEDLVSPRQSFLGANPEVEKLLLGGGDVKVKTEEDVDVTADEVARATHAGRKLAKPPKKKAKFLKPSDDDF